MAWETYQSKASDKINMIDHQYFLKNRNRLPASRQKQSKDQDQFVRPALEKLSRGKFWIACDDDRVSSADPCARQDSRKT